MSKKTKQKSSELLAKLIKENSELEERMVNLQSFRECGNYEDLHEKHKELLDDQFSSMIPYHDALRSRIFRVKIDIANDKRAEQ